MFNLEVPKGGYAWWYVDGVSDCGTKAVSVIGFIGSVFSPWYHWSGRGNPADNCCINVATYGPGGRFTMTDRGEAALQATPDMLRVGPSSMYWNGTELVIDIDEISSPPIISRVRGQITITPDAVTNVELPLTPDGAHVWRPFAPSSRIKVDLEAKGWQWSGHGYFDANFGTRPLEKDFSYWTWGRYPTRDGATCFYDADRRDGTSLDAAIAFDREGQAKLTEAPARTPFKRTLWALRRETRADAGTTPRQIKAMLDAPFYSRSVVETVVNGEKVQGVHEALDLDRYKQPLLKPMLAVRVPRRKGWTF
ncbi:carotenoid 1,2-hydratase [bacterium]|nr:carotenoid 1,2-hydratase [bacterium]